MLKLGESRKTRKQERNQADSGIILLCTRSAVASGALNDAIWIATALRERKIPVQVWALYSADGVRVAGVDRCFSESAPEGIVDTARMLRAFKTAYIGANPKAVVGFHPLANVLLGLLARVVGTPSRVATQRNPASSQRPVLRMLDLLAGATGGYTDNIAISTPVENSYSRYPRTYRKCLHVVENGVPRRLGSHKSATTRRQWRLPEAVALIGTVGRCSRQKNQAVLIRALALLDDAHLVIVGDGELRASLEELADQLDVARRVTFLGRVGSDQVPDLLASLDVFAFPSNFEGFGIALVEAMQNGLPCAVSNLPVFTQILGADGRSGTIVEDSTPEAWANALDSLLRNPEVARQLGAHARIRARTYDFDDMVDGYLSIIQQPGGTRA